jgi:hypothetical protein
VSTRVSPDGMYYWDGQGWVTTLSPDGRHRWNGVAWVPIADQPYIAVPGQQAGAARQPTSWTRPLQYAVAGWYVWSAIYSLTIPFWMGGLMAQIMNQSIANQQRLNPDAAPPAGFTDMMQNAATIGMWIGVVVLVGIFIVPFIGALRRWTWIYYVVMVLLVISALLLPLDLFDAALGSRLSSASTFAMPSWFYILNFVTGLPGVALLAWMLIAQITRGPWAMKRIS